MTQPALSFSDADVLGRVASVDTSRVFIEVSEHELLTSVGIGNLVAVRGATQQEYLIGVVERIRRATGGLPDPKDQADDHAAPAPPQDEVQAVLVGTYRTREGESRDVFKRGADSFPQIDCECHLLSGPNLQTFMGLLAAGVPEAERLELGRFVQDRTATAIASGDRFFQRHASILGSTGSGKSWAVALLLERASRLAYPNVIVLDMHGEYAPLCEAGTGFARRYRIAGPGDLDKSDDSCVFLPYWLLTHDEATSMLLDRSDTNAPNQASRFTSHVRDLKHAALQKAAKAEVARTFTVDSPVPYSLDELIGKLEADNTERVTGSSAGGRAGDWNNKLTRFIARLTAKSVDRRYGFLFQPPNESFDYGWLPAQARRFMESEPPDRPGVKVVDFSEVPADVLPVVTSVFVRLLYDIQFWMEPSKRTPMAFVCDEAHLYLPVRSDADSVARRALDTFERVAKEGRKYGVSLVVVSQRPADVSRTILSQCNNFLVMRLTNEEDQGAVRSLLPDNLSGITDVLPLLDTGEALVLGDAVMLPSRIKLDAPRVKPASATRDFWQEWTKCQPDGEAIVAAVEALRRQTRSPD